MVRGRNLRFQLGFVKTATLLTFPQGKVRLSGLSKVESTIVSAASTTPRPNWGDC